MPVDSTLFLGTNRSNEHNSEHNSEHNWNL